MPLKGKFQKPYKYLNSKEIRIMNEITATDRRLEDLMSQKTQLIDRVRELEGQLSRSIRDFEFDLAQRLFEQIIDLQKIVLVTDEINARLDTGVNRPSYLVGSALLHEAFSFLSQLKNESILYVSGNRFGNAYMLSRLIPPELDRSEPGYASANNVSSLHKLGDLERHGSLLCAYLHMHPGRGNASTSPSSVDLSCQRRLEKGGYPVIGGIFSRDGYLRFFSDQPLFDVSLSGKGVDHVGKDLFKLARII
jgi:hypothetical protein